jgi:peptide-methionine (R)-S-oxide reductase
MEKDKKDDYWKEKLSPEEYKVLREGATEKPFSGKLLDNKEGGMYKCRACGNPLFSSENKFDSGTGWPSFSDVVSNENIETREDKSFGINRVEVLCKKCGSHLGHIFPDGPRDKGGKRYCINSVCLNFEKEKKSL